MILSWGSAGTAISGELTSGDRGVFVPFPGGALVAVIDGLGHGEEAAKASLRAEHVLLAAPYAPVAELMTQCHEQLKGTRGAVITLASFDGEHDTMSWLGVGNVEAILVRAEEGSPDEAVAMRGGTVGFLLPPLHPRTLKVATGDTLVLATDGIRHGFKAEVIRAREPQEIADAILRVCGKTTDDAYVMVARYAGMSGTRRIGIDGEEDVAHARSRARELAQGVGLPASATEALVAAVSELARNIVMHARYGEIVIEEKIEPLGRRRGIAVIARDIGPGIEDIHLAMQDGFTTAGSMGSGLPAARRLVDRLEISSRVGVGTVVTIEKWAS
jgi:anti-sigma regulatory factor (Ser/Thr protein kinase)